MVDRRRLQSGRLVVRGGAVRRPPRAAVWWLPIALAGVYGLIVLGRFRGLTAYVYTNSDFAMAPVIGHALGSTPPGTHVMIGDYGWYEPLVFIRFTDWLPFHRQLWDVAPLLFDVGALALLVWSVRRAFGVWSAALVGAAVVCLGEGGLIAFVAFNSHGATAVHAVVLGVVLAWLAPRERVIPWPWLAIGSLGLGLLSGAAVPDHLFLVWGLAPFVLAAILVAWRATTPATLRLVAFALATTAVALLAGGAFTAVMHHNGVGTAAVPLTFAASSALPGQFVEMLEDLTQLVSGDFFGLPIDFVGVATFASGALVLGAVAMVLIELRRRVRLAAARAPGRGSETVTPRFAHTSFWSICLVVSLGAFTFGSFGGGAGGARYLLAAYIAVAALLPLLVERGFGFRLSLAAAVSLLALLSTYQLVRGPVNPQVRSPSTGEENAFARFAASHDLKYGYAGYWDSLPFTWASDFRVNVFPVFQCAQGSLTLCPFPTVTVSSWYSPRPHTRTFLIVDPTEPFVSAPDPALGKPTSTAVIGHLQIYVYPYDIASRLRAG